MPFVWYWSANGRPFEEPRGGRLPPEADYWWQPGLPDWVRIERKPDEPAGDVWKPRVKRKVARR